MIDTWYLLAAITIMFIVSHFTEVKATDSIILLLSVMVYHLHLQLNTIIEGLK